VPEERGLVKIDDLTHAAFSGVLRALEERQLEPRRWPGPILVGIIAWPELGKGEFNVGQSAGE
jgi:hypothetical protein